MTDLTISGERLSRRLEAREWLRNNAPRAPLGSMDTPEGQDAYREWEHALAEARWSVVQWPSAHGGRDYDAIDWLLFEEEYYAAGAPSRINQNAISLLGATLLEFGTGEQQQRILPSIINGDVVWAQAWSEPGAGSDLAAVSSRAVRVDGGYELTGQKVWSSRANIADRGFGLFRSGPSGRSHKGLTYFMFPLRDPKVTVRAIHRIDGDPVFAEIFFDGLFVPDADVIGAEGEGWNVAMATAAKERGVNLRSPGRFTARVTELISLWHLLDESDQARHLDPIQRAWSAAQSYRLYGFRSAAESVDSARSGIGKPFWSALDVSLHETGLRILDDAAATISDEEHVALRQRWVDGYLFSLAGPIYAGTNEIQKNIIAERVLGLPRR